MNFNDLIIFKGRVIRKLKQYNLKDILMFYKVMKIPRYTETQIKFRSEKITIADSHSFVNSYKELFNENIYQFKTNKENPFIVDCGSNIGLSIIYFKTLFPKAHVVGFEPDPQVFKILSKNINGFKYENVELINKALSDQETEMEYFSEGADGGRLEMSGENMKKITVSTTKLSNFLKRKVDLLKIDIEGYETKILKESAELLVNVNSVFIEYHSSCQHPQTLDEILLILKNAGFRYYINNAINLSKQPLTKIETYLGWDLQLNIFAYK